LLATPHSRWYCSSRFPHTQQKESRLRFGPAPNWTTGTVEVHPEFDRCFQLASSVLQIRIHARSPASTRSSERECLHSARGRNRPTSCADPRYRPEHSSVHPVRTGYLKVRLAPPSRM